MNNISFNGFPTKTKSGLNKLKHNLGKFSDPVSMNSCLNNDAQNSWNIAGEKVTSSDNSMILFLKKELDKSNFKLGEKNVLVQILKELKQVASFMSIGLIPLTFANQFKEMYANSRNNMVSLIKPHQELIQSNTINPNPSKSFIDKSLKKTVKEVKLSKGNLYPNKSLLTIESAKERLSSMGFSEDFVNKLNLDKPTCSQLLGFQYYLEKDKDFKDKINKSSTEEKNKIFESIFFSDKAVDYSFMTRENYLIIKKYFKEQDDLSVLKVLLNINEYSSKKIDHILSSDKVLESDKADLVASINKDNENVVNLIVDTDKILPLNKKSFLQYVNRGNNDCVGLVLNTNKIDKIQKVGFMGAVNCVNKDKAKIILNTNQINQDEKIAFMKAINIYSKPHLDLLLETKKLSKSLKLPFIYAINKSNTNRVSLIISSDVLSDANKVYCLKEINSENNNVVPKIIVSKDIADEDKPSLIKVANKVNESFLSLVLKSKHVGNKIYFLKNITVDNRSIVPMVLKTTNLPDDLKPVFLENVNMKNISIAETVINTVSIQDELKPEFMHGVRENNIDSALKILDTTAISNDLKPKFMNGITPENKNFIDKILSSHLISYKYKSDFITSINNENQMFVDTILATRKIPDEYKAKFMKQINSENMLYVERILDIKEFTPEYKIKFLAGINKTNKGIFDQVLSSQDLYLDKNLMENFVENVPEYFKSETPNIIKKHQDLINSAFANKDILKTGLKDLSDKELLRVMTKQSIIFSLDKLGMKNLKAVFPFMIDKFNDFCYDLSIMKLSPANVMALKRRINFQNTKKYQDAVDEIKTLKISLQELLTVAERKRVLGLQKQQKLYAPKEKEAKAIQAQIQSIYFNSSNSVQIKQRMQLISTKTKKLKNINLSLNKTTPQDVIKRMRVLIALARRSSEQTMKEFISIISDTSPDGDRVWNERVNAEIFCILGVKYDERLAKKLNLINCKYLSEMLVASTISAFCDNMRSLIYVVMDHPEMTIKEAIDSLPQNIETRKQFEKLGISYDKYVDIDKNSFKDIVIETKEQDVKQSVVNNINEDCASEYFDFIPQKQQDEIKNELRKIGVTVEHVKEEIKDVYGGVQGYKETRVLRKDGRPIKFEDVHDILKSIKYAVNGDEFWSVTQSNPEINKAREELYEHIIKLRMPELQRAISMNGDLVSEIKIRKTNMYDIKKAIGIGNDAQCCTGLGRFYNEWTAPTYIKNKCIGAFEIVDKNDFVGNTMFYLAYVDGKPALILDNIELKTRYQRNEQIRQAFIDYAKSFCAEIGRPDLEIYVGPHRNKLDMTVFEKKPHKFEFIGSTGDDTVYIDFDTEAHKFGSEAPYVVELYKLR